MVDLLFVLGGKSDDMADFIASAHTSDSAAIRRLVLLEQGVIEELKGGKGVSRETPEKGPDGKFVKRAPETKTTAAPPPPREVGGRSGQPPDEMAEVLKIADPLLRMRAFKVIGDRKALNRRRGS